VCMLHITCILLWFVGSQHTELLLLVAAFLGKSAHSDTTVQASKQTFLGHDGSRFIGAC